MLVSSIAYGACQSRSLALTEGHLQRQIKYDPHPNSSFSPLPPAFNLSSKGRKDQVAAGQKAELNHILQPGYRSTSTETDGDLNSIAGPSRHGGPRTAGGLAGSKKTAGLGMRSSPSTGSLRAPNSAGFYVDSSGNVHDTEFDPFAGVGRLSKKKSYRRSAFGQERRRGSGSSSSSSKGSEDRQRKARQGSVALGAEGKDEEEVKRRLEMEKRSSNEISGYTLARRRSILSDRSSGRATSPLLSAQSRTVQLDRLGGQSKSSQGRVRSPLSPTSGGQISASSFATSRTLPTTIEVADADKHEESPNITSEVTKLPVGSDKKIKQIGFQVPRPETPLGSIVDSLRPPEKERPAPASRASSVTSQSRPRKPAERPREELFPETPAQLKKREERARLTREGGSSRGASLAVDTVLSSGGRGRILPEIEILDDDDPRIVFPADGRATRVQTTHDHVIRGPFSLALEAQSSRRGSADYSSRSILGGPSSKAPSTIIDEGGGGYLPSRWATGDRQLRQTEDEKEKYRPREWGGKTGELGGRQEEWK